MKPPEQPSAFVKRCQDALAEYQRLRFLGAGHEVAARQLREALRGNEMPSGCLVVQPDNASDGCANSTTENA